MVSRRRGEGEEEIEVVVVGVVVPDVEACDAVHRSWAGASQGRLSCAKEAASSRDVCRCCRRPADRTSIVAVAVVVGMGHSPRRLIYAPFTPPSPETKGDELRCAAQRGRSVKVHGLKVDDGEDFPTAHASPSRLLLPIGCAPLISESWSPQ